jgi:hypothetical protein
MSDTSAITTSPPNGQSSDAAEGIIEFQVGTSRTINLGNYESLKIEASVTMEVHEGANMDELRAAAQKELRKLLEDTYIAQHRKT